MSVMLLTMQSTTWITFRSIFREKKRYFAWLLEGNLTFSHRNKTHSINPLFHLIRTNIYNKNKTGQNPFYDTTIPVCKILISIKTFQFVLRGRKRVKREEQTLTQPPKKDSEKILIGVVFPLTRHLLFFITFLGNWKA